MILVNCKNCGRQVTKTTGRFNESIKNGWNFFCSLRCRYGYQEKGVELPCARCQRPVRKTPGQLRQTLRNVFCSKSCAAVFNNAHKRGGTRRSTLEVFIEQRIRAEYRGLTVECNKHDPINAELDFYFPELRLAVELNGIFHYQPIYGQEKFERIKEKDRQKLARCLAAGIELCVIDVSDAAYRTREVKEKYWSVIKELVASVQKRAGHTNVQVP